MKRCLLTILLQLIRILILAKVQNIHAYYRKYCIQLLLIFSLKNISATFILLLLKRTFVNLLGNSESEITEKGDEKSGGMDNVLDILINCSFYFLILSWQRVI